MTWRKTVFACVSAPSLAMILWASFASGQISEDPPSQMVVHEWGTFTSLHDEAGHAIEGINSDDEPVPGFVHRIANQLVLRPGADIPIFAKSAPHAHPHVTMRLETPVVYFYPPEDSDLPVTLDVEVVFPSGWLSEYYPDAEVEAPGVVGPTQFGPITPDTVGRLRWKNLKVGTETDGPETTSHVWLAPRQVAAAGVTTEAGESERYLFYRGVGRVESPVRVARDETGKSLIVSAAFPVVQQSAETSLVVPRLWLVDVRENRECAFREIAGFDVPNDGEPRVVAKTAAAFDESNFSTQNIEKLRGALRTDLIADGLFADEADALLNTWELSYFKSPGLRLFFLLPRAWTDHVLPLKLSVDANLVRTMVGRVEIVTPEQRDLLARIARGPVAAPNLRTYSELGRFRNALVLDELQRRPTTALQKFIESYGLQAYQPPQTDLAKVEPNPSVNPSQ